MNVRDLYFMSLCGWLLHPGYQREGAIVPSLREIADLVDDMIRERDARWPQ
ncbi:MAG: hypothetical protein [Microvirus sp.]|nr:MAG: hypothetical protein [Microvirus sp.]